jgi:hypothetical protein
LSTNIARKETKQNLDKSFVIFVCRGGRGAEETTGGSLFILYNFLFIILLFSSVFANLADQEKYSTNHDGIKKLQDFKDFLKQLNRFLLCFCQ